jgi:phage shock protein PspC (stress-responsive transcriptional regulator)
VLAGVCRALANYFEVDVVIIRLVWVLVLLLGGTGFLAYVIAWIVIPSEPERLPVAAGTQGAPTT